MAPFPSDPASPPTESEGLFDPIARRTFLKGVAAVGAASTVTTIGTAAETAAAVLDAPIASVGSRSFASELTLNLTVNGQARSLPIDPRTTLLDALRERMDLTGTKKGCNHGQCGACTVLVDGRRVNSCLTLAATVEGQHVQTIEGFAHGDDLHPVQAAFLEHDGFQCGYCTPGQICSTVAMIEEIKSGQLSAVTPSLDGQKGPVEPNEKEIRERMSGNLCRCGAYNGIVAAAQDAFAKAGGAA